MSDTLETPKTSIFTKMLNAARPAVIDENEETTPEMLKAARKRLIIKTAVFATIPVAITVAAKLISNAQKTEVEETETTD